MNQKAFTFLLFILFSCFQCSCQTKPIEKTAETTDVIKKEATTKTPAQIQREKRIAARAARNKDFSFLTLEGKKIHYRDEGTTGPVMILIHGMGSNLTQWNHYTDYFKANFRVISLDLPGGRFGKSEAMFKVAHTDNLVIFLDQFMTALSIEKAHIVGSSYGGSTGFNFAVTYSKKVDKLILIAPAIRGDNQLVEKITNPTLIIWGEKDPILPVEQANYLNDNIQNSKLLIYEDGPHVPISNEYAERSMKDIEKFLNTKK